VVLLLVEGTGWQWWWRYSQRVDYLVPFGRARQQGDLLQTEAKIPRCSWSVVGITDCQAATVSIQQFFALSHTTSLYMFICNDWCGRVWSELNCDLHKEASAADSESPSAGAGDAATADQPTYAKGSDDGAYMLCFLNPSRLDCPSLFCCVYKIGAGPCGKSTTSSP
jgi:hypothetical protein